MASASPVGLQIGRVGADCEEITRTFAIAFSRCRVLLDLIPTINSLTLAPRAYGKRVAEWEHGQYIVWRFGIAVDE
jgi:hypothetical protein